PVERLSQNAHETFDRGRLRGDPCVKLYSSVNDFGPYKDRRLAFVNAVFPLLPLRLVFCRQRREIFRKIEQKLEALPRLKVSKLVGNLTKLFRRRGHIGQTDQTATGKAIVVTSLE